MIDISLSLIDLIKIGVEDEKLAVYLLWNDLRSNEIPSYIPVVLIYSSYLRYGL